jgi:hypothetical protein
MGKELTGTFQLTFEDFEEAVRPPAVDAKGNYVSPTAAAKRAGRGRGAVGWVLFALTGVMLFLLIRSNRPTRTYAPIPSVAGIIQPPGEDLVAFLLVAFVPLAFCWIIVVFLLVSTIQKLRKPKDGKKSAQWVGRTFGIALTLLSVATIGGAMSRQIHLTWHPTRTLMLTVGLVPWLVSLVLWIAIFNRLGKSQRRVAWKTQTGLHLPRTVVVNDEGLRLIDTEVDQLYRWGYFKSAHETDRLFVLRNNELFIVMVPKRAFPRPDDAIALRGIFYDRIPEKRFFEQPSAFPTIPLAKLAPVNPSGPTS